MQIWVPDVRAPGFADEMRPTGVPGRLPRTAPTPDLMGFLDAALDDLGDWN